MFTTKNFLLALTLVLVAHCVDSAVDYPRECDIVATRICDNKTEIYVIDNAFNRCLKITECDLLKLKCIAASYGISFDLTTYADTEECLSLGMAEGKECPPEEIEKACSNQGSTVATSLDGGKTCVTCDWCEQIKAICFLRQLGLTITEPQQVDIGSCEIVTDCNKNCFPCDVRKQYCIIYEGLKPMCIDECKLRELNCKNPGAVQIIKSDRCGGCGTDTCYTDCKCCTADSPKKVVCYNDGTGCIKINLCSLNELNCQRRRNGLEEYPYFDCTQCECKPCLNAQNNCLRVGVVYINYNGTCKVFQSDCEYQQWLCTNKLCDGQYVEYPPITELDCRKLCCSRQYVESYPNCQYQIGYMTFDSRDAAESYICGRRYEHPIRPINCAILAEAEPVLLP